MRSGSVSAQGATYADGLADGIKMTLDHLQGRRTDETQEDGFYRGPMPTELSKWADDVRARIEELQS